MLDTLDGHLLKHLTDRSIPPSPFWLIHTNSAAPACFIGLLFIFIHVWGFTLAKSKATVPEWYHWIWVLPVFIARPTLVFTGVSRGLQGLAGVERKENQGHRGTNCRIWSLFLPNKRESCCAKSHWLFLCLLPRPHPFSTHLENGLCCPFFSSIPECFTPNSVYLTDNIISL